MGLGNGNPNQGNKGSNFGYQLRVLQLLSELITANSPISGLATETTLSDIDANLTTYNTGTVTPNVLTPGLPFTTNGNENSVTVIVKAGTVQINGSTLPVGTYSFSCGSNETLEAMTISDSAGGSIIVLTTIKN